MDNLNQANDITVKLAEFRGGNPKLLMNPAADNLDLEIRVVIHSQKLKPRFLSC